MDIILPRKSFYACLLVLVLFSGSYSSVFSQAVIIHSSNLDEEINVGAPITYCIKILRDTLTGISPTGKSFGIVGYPYPIIVTDPDPPGLENERIGGVFTGRAFLDLTVVPANFELIYHTEARRWPVIVRDPDVVTLTPFAGPLCSDDPPFYLTGGSPAGGYYTVNGVIGNSFNPSTAGPGTYYIYYLTGFGDCLASSPVQTITVLPLPDVSIAPVPDVCVETPPVTLREGAPAGGTYNGPGITGNIFNPAAAGVGTHTISYTFTDGYCPKTAYGTITVSAMPVTSFTAIDSVYCDTDPPVNLNGNPAGGTFRGNGIINISPGIAVFDPSKSGLGIHPITYTYTNPTGCTDTYTRMIRVGTLLTITGIDPLYCQSSSPVTFNYYPPGGSFEPLAGLTDNSNGTATFSPANSIPGSLNLSYTYTDLLGCINNITQPVDVAPTPFVNFVGIGPSFCINDTPVLLTGNHAPSGVFAGPGITDNGNGTAVFDPSVIPAGGPYNITYSYTDPVTDCGSSKTITTSIIALPTATISGNSNICYGRTAELAVYFTGAGPFDFIYSDGTADVSVTGVMSPYKISVSPTTSSVYTIKSVRGSNGCSGIGRGTGTVTVNPPVVFSAGESQFLCSDSASLNATLPAGATGRWSISEGSAAFRDNTLYNTRVYNLQHGENKLVWTVTTSACSISDTLMVVNNLPSVPVAGPDQDLCLDHLTMSANQPVSGTGRWSVISGSASFAGLDDPTTEVTGLGKGLNVLRWTISNGSCDLFDEVSIRNSLPTVAYAGADRVVCNSSATLLATAPLSGTGSWSVVSGYGIFADSSANSTVVSNLGPGLNTLRWTTDNGKCSTFDDIIVTNNLFEAFAGPDQIVYSPDARLTGNRPATGTREWKLTAGSGIISDPSSYETTVTGLGEGANTFTWTVDNNGCIATDEVSVIYKVLPVVDFKPYPGSGCPPVSISFINNSVGGFPYSWDFGDGSSSTTNNADHTYDYPGNFTVRLTATGPDGIILHKDTVIVVSPIPVANMEITPDTAYIPGNSVRFFNLSGDVDSLLWDFGDGTVSADKNPSHKYLSPGSYNVTLNVWSDRNCHDSLFAWHAVYVERAGILTCPNAFTPNPDGPSGGHYNPNDFTNDVFHCFAEGITEYHLEVYNRHGIILFRSDDTAIGWDGYFNGRLVTEGVYVYKVYGRYKNGESFNKVGNIVLVN